MRENRTSEDLNYNTTICFHEDQIETHDCSCDKYRENNAGLTMTSPRRKCCNHIGSTLFALMQKQHAYYGTSSFSSIKGHLHSNSNSTMNVKKLYELNGFELKLSEHARNTQAVFQREVEETKTYAARSVSFLKALLEKNGMKKNGKKDELVKRCVDGALNGSLPKCLQCGGNIYYANGGFHCFGFYDQHKNEYQVCQYYTETVKRKPWIPYV